MDGKLYTNGVILEIETGKLLKHSLTDLNDKSKLLSVITYEFAGNGAQTLLRATEELNYEMTTDELKDASNGWDAALKAVKETAEKI